MPTITVRVAASGDDGYWSEGNSSFNNNGADLQIGYINSTLKRTHSFMRFLALTIPQGAFINAAYLTLRSTVNWSNWQAAQIFGVAADDPAAPTSYAEAAGLSLTTESGWFPSGTWVSGEDIESPSLTAVIKEITDRVGWASGNDLILCFKYAGGDSSSYTRKWASYDAGAETAPLLTVTYSIGKSASDTIALAEDVDVLVGNFATDTISLSETVAGGHDGALADTISFSEHVLVDKNLVVNDGLYLTDALVAKRGDWSVVRQHPHTTSLYMAVKKPRTIWTGRVADTRGTNQSGDMEADLTINVTGGANVSGFDITDFLPDLTLWVGSTAGSKDHGVCRLRAFDGSNLKVGADMSCVWHKDDYLSVMDLHDYWPKFHKTSASGTAITVLKDGDLTYAARKEQPVPIMGPPACAFLDSITGEVTVKFDGSDSYLIQPNSDYTYWSTPHGISAYAWWFEGANVETASSAVASATYSTPGQYIARLTVTGENGETAIGFRNVFIYERSGPNAPIDHFNIQELNGSQNNHGWEGEIEVFGDYFSTTDLPNDAQIVIFSEELFGGDPQTVRLGLAGLHDRMNVKFVGWITTTRLSYSAGKVRSAQVTIKGLQQLLSSKGNYPCYWTQVEDNAPAWSKFSVAGGFGLTVRKVWYHTIRWHWTLLNFTDVYIPDDHNNYLPGQSFSEGTLASWLDEFTKDTQAKWAVDKGGALHIYSEPNWLPVAGYAPPATRADGTLDIPGEQWRYRLYTGIALGEDDVERLDADPRVQQEVARVRVEGVMASDTGWYATSVDMAPGDIRGLDGSTDITSNQVLGTGGFYGSQGHGLALVKYAEQTRNIERLRLTFAGNYSFFDIVPYSNWFTITVAPPKGLRELSWTDRAFWLTSMSMTYDAKTGDLAVSGEAIPETYPDFTLSIYSQKTDIGGARQLTGQSGAVTLASTLKQIDTPDVINIPALLGDGAGHVETQDGGTVFARLYGDLNYLIEAESKLLDPEDNRPVLIQQLKNAVGVRARCVIATREDDDTYASSQSKLSRTIRHATFCKPGVVTKSTYIIPFLTVGAELKKVAVRRVLARGTLADTGAVNTVTAVIYHTGTALIPISLSGNGAQTATVPVTATLTTGDWLGVSITAAVGIRDLLIEVECVVYGI